MRCVVTTSTLLGVLLIAPSPCRVPKTFLNSMDQRWPEGSVRVILDDPFSPNPPSFGQKKAAKETANTTPITTGQYNSRAMKLSL